MSRHACNCRECAEGRIVRKEFQGGGMDWETDEEELLPYRKHKGKNMRRKGKVCKKSKADEPCDFSVKKVYRSYGGKTDYVMTCSRCGKHGTVLWDNTWRFDFEA